METFEGDQSMEIARIESTIVSGAAAIAQILQAIPLKFKSIYM